MHYLGFGVTPQKLTLFGQMLHGMEVVDAIANAETTGPGNPQEGILPNNHLEDIIILSVTLGEYK